MTHSEIYNALSAFRIPFNTEARMQATVAEILSLQGWPFKSECRLSDTDRIDFLQRVDSEAAIKALAERYVGKPRPRPSPSPAGMTKRAARSRNWRRQRDVRSWRSRTRCCTRRGPRGGFMAETHNCRICNKVSPHDGRRCLGCATPIANAKVTTKAPAKPRCPRCGSGSHRPLTFDRARLECQACHAVFEPPDGYAVDTRPDVNAEKRERASEWILKGGRR